MFNGIESSPGLQEPGEENPQEKISLGFGTETFERISDEKRDRIFTTAISEFAEHGYSAASINTIARKAGVSIGGMYKYFDSKEDLFLAMVGKGLELLNRIILELGSLDEPVFEVIDRLLHLTVRYAKKHADLSKLYLLMTTEELAPLADRLSEKMETSFHDFYLQLLSAAKERGEIKEGADINLAAYMIDNLVIMLQLSYSVTYYRRRLEKYLGLEAAEDDEALCLGLLEHIRNSLAA
ncbi:MAG: TetR/AcrR family transcriptional regulator [Anaerolineaceae bacterium]|nr:TetR/AcrR family transcriptional regulator [Anaerolineaceae bacterium]